MKYFLKTYAMLMHECVSRSVRRTGCTFYEGAEFLCSNSVWRAGRASTPKLG